MSDILKESKSQLAKLMANENLQIEHQKINTAKFDPKNRILYLPIWTNMEGFTYDLLCGHEVGHALFTPAEGWHDAITENSKGKNYKNFLNVVEDARIEKRVQRKYPGLKQSFKKAYAELVKKDFFGLEGRVANELPFIDRLNLFTKSQYTWPLNFNDEESVFIERVKNTESWEDVVTVTDDIYAYSKEEQLEYEDELNFDNVSWEDQEDEEDEDGGNGSSRNGENVEEDGEDGENDQDTNSYQEASGDIEELPELEEEELTYINRDKESNSESDFEPSCQTDEMYRENESLLVDDQCKEYVYIDLPETNLKNIFTPAKRVQELLTESFIEQELKPQYVDSLLDKFKKKNDKYISLLAKEFEMKKAASVFAKRKTSNTGDLDINKLASYKFNDDIFRKMMVIPNGKSHGLILLLDYSGSMWENMAGAIEQILVLSGFCRKVNIPFSVLSFSFDEEIWFKDRPNISPEEINFRTEPAFKKTNGTLALHNVMIREYLNSNMNNVEYTKALKNMVTLKTAYENARPWHISSWQGGNYVSIPPTERLTTTPLSEAVYALGEYTKQFKESKNLDLVNLVIVQDGDADMNKTYWKFGQDPWSSKKEEVTYKKSMNIYENINIIRDNKINFSAKYDRDTPVSEIIMAWYKKYTGAKIIGFYILKSKGAKTAIMRQYVDENQKSLDSLPAGIRWPLHQELTKQLRKTKLLVSHKPQYDDFYFIMTGKDLDEENPEIEVNGTVTANKLKTAFMKVNKTKRVNRVLVNKFIEKIAA